MRTDFVVLKSQAVPVIVRQFIHQKRKSSLSWQTCSGKMHRVTIQQFLEIHPIQAVLHIQETELVPWVAVLIPLSSVASSMPLQHARPKQQI